MIKRIAAGVCLLAAAGLLCSAGCSTQSSLTKEEAASISGRPMPPGAAQKMAEAQREWAKKNKPWSGPTTGAPAGPPAGK